MPDIETTQFLRPIPGQALTTEVGSRPWERPAKYNTPEEALDYYLEQLSLPERTAQMLEIIESGFPIADLVDVITLGGVMQGLHSIDIAVIISPVIYELIVSVADEVKVKYETGLTPSDKNRTKDASLIARAMKEPPEDELMEKVMSAEGEKIRKVAAGLMAQSPKEIE